MSIYTKLILFLIVVGCFICLCNLAEFAGLVLNVFVVYLVLRCLAPAFAGSQDSKPRNAPLTQ